MSQPRAHPRVRSGAPEDLEAVARLEAVCLGRDAWSEGLLQEGLSGRLPSVTVLVAERGAEVGGDVVGHAVAAHAGDVVELQRIGVHPDHRRAGLATALLRAVVGLRGAGERVLLEVREDNGAAIAFYLRAGFAEIARRPRYYADGATAVVMELAATREV